MLRQTQLTAHYVHNVKPDTRRVRTQQNAHGAAQRIVMLAPIKHTAASVFKDLEKQSVALVPNATPKGAQHAQTMGWHAQLASKDSTCWVKSAKLAQVFVLIARVPVSATNSFSSFSKPSWWLMANQFWLYVTATVFHARTLTPRSVLYAQTGTSCRKADVKNVRENAKLVTKLTSLCAYPAIQTLSYLRQHAKAVIPNAKHVQMPATQTNAPVAGMVTIWVPMTVSKVALRIVSHVRMQQPALSVFLDLLFSKTTGNTVVRHVFLLAVHVRKANQPLVWLAELGSTKVELPVPNARPIVMLAHQQVVQHARLAILWPLNSHVPKTAYYLARHVMSQSRLHVWTVLQDTNITIKLRVVIK